MIGGAPKPEPTDALDEAPDPALAAVALERVREAGGVVSPRALPSAVRLLGFSTAATDFLVRHPEECGALEDDAARDRAALDAEVAADVERLGAEAGLRRFRRRALLRVAARDLAGASLEDVVREVSDVADACVEAACRFVSGDALAVVALGKWGALELNYASDIDLVFVHREPGGATQDAAERVAAELIHLLSEPTSDGIALKLDAALRPGGRAGALSRSLEATLAYYERESATWERQAMLKARAAAGDVALARRFVEGVQAFVYPAHLEPAAIDDVRRTKVRLEEYIRQRGKELTEVKRGRGGIRDVEFAVQLLQLVHGRRDPSLREPNTLKALTALVEEGYVAPADADPLADAYRFLRRLEHRLQIVRDVQTHDLPSDPRARTTIARSLGLADAAALQREYDRTTGLVRTIHERLFYRPLLEAFAGPATPRPGLDRAATEELLAGLGFAQPSRSYEVLARLVDPATRFGKVMANVFVVMAPALSLAADPDAALVRLERVGEAVGERPGPADALAADPAAARRLAHVVGASRFATDLLVRDPERIRVLAERTIHADDAGADMVRVVGRYAGRELSPRETGDAITAVADRVLQEAVDEAAPSLPLAVIGMGKLGARELSFASDLDVVFVYDGEGPEDQSRAVEASERVMQLVLEAGWEIDADLRPEGRNGPLARSLAGFLDYWERYAELWEAQALLRVRDVAGDEQLGHRFAAAARDLAYRPEGITIDEVVQIRRMRERIERERVRPPEATKFHFKLGYGSLADVQFTVETLLLRHGGSVPAVRTTRTLGGDRAAGRAPADGADRRARPGRGVRVPDGREVRAGGRPPGARRAVPAAAEEQTALARRLGYEEYPRQAFIDDYLRITRRARRAMERVFAQELE